MTQSTLARTIVNYYKQRMEAHLTEYEQGIEVQKQQEKKKGGFMSRAQAAMTLQSEIEVPCRVIGPVPELSEVISCLIQKVSSLNEGDIFPIYADPREVETLCSKDKKVAQSSVLFCPGGSLIVSTIGYKDGLPTCAKIHDYGDLEVLESAKVFDAAAFSDIAMNYYFAMQGRGAEVEPMKLGMPVDEKPSVQIQDMRESQRWEILEQEE